VSSHDNPWLPEELVAERAYLYRVDPDAAAHVWGGECRQATDAQILRGKWTVEAFEPEAGWDGPYHGADFGFAHDPTTLVRCWVHQRTLYVEHEAYRVGLELDDTAAHWQRHVPDCARYTIRADSARPESISYLRRHGLPQITGVQKWPGSVEDGIAHLRSYERIVLHPRCTHAADEARHWSYKVDQRTGDVLPVVVDANDHVWDAVRYALAPLIRARTAPRAYVSTASLTLR
jgi:phage terminase large subunit